MNLWDGIKVNFTGCRERAVRRLRVERAKYHLEYWADYGHEDDLANAIRALQGLDKAPRA